jgi:hypothetical protein
MAETFFTPETTSILADILEPQYNGSVGRAAAWADGYAHTSEGRFSYQWHWIDTHDHPPQSCKLDYTRDCAEGGCIVSAIANQTGILQGCIDQVRSGALSGGSNLTCSYALKWVAHFLGDIAQPLHASGRAAGGNFYKVTFANVSTELHAVSTTYPHLLNEHLQNRSGMASFLTTLQESTSLSRITRSTRFSHTSFLESAEMGSTRLHTCGQLVAHPLRLCIAQQAGQPRVTSGHAIMSMDGFVEMKTWVTTATQMVLSQLSNCKSVRLRTGLRHG